MVVPDSMPARACLVTAPANGRPRYHLMELPSDLVHLFESSGATKRKACQREGDEDDDTETQKRPTLCIKGRRNDEAVLCTDTQTYVVRQVTQSNSLLLCTLGSASTEAQREAGVVTVRDNIVQILEVVPVVARVGRLTTLLRDSAYAGEEHDEEKRDGMRRYTPQQVASVVQASAAELRVALRHAYVVEMDGYLRIMSHAYLTEALRVLLAHVERLAVSPQRVMIGAAAAALRDVHDMRREAAEALLTEWFGRPSTGEEGDDTVDEPAAAHHKTEFVALDSKSIARFLGLQLLRSEAHATPMELSVYLHRWSELLGPTLADNVNIDLLQGNHLLWPAPPAQPSNLQPASIQYLASSELPLDIASRFQRLFTLRSQWTAADLAPFLQEVATDAKRRDALLLKFARTSQVQVPVAETKQERRARLANGKAHPPMRNVQLYSSRLRY